MTVQVGAPPLDPPLHYKNIKESKNSTCWLVLVVIVKLWFSVFLLHIIIHPKVTNDDVPFKL